MVDSVLLSYKDIFPGDRFPLMAILSGRPVWNPHTKEAIVAFHVLMSPYNSKQLYAS